MTKFVYLRVITVFFIVISPSVSYSQSFYHINKKAIGYSFSDSNVDETGGSSHKLYISTGIADLFFLYSDNSSSDYRVGINVYKVDDTRIWYPSFSFFMLSNDNNTGFGAGTSLPLKVYCNDNFDLIPEIGAAIYFFGFNKNILKDGETCLELGLNMGYHLSEHAVITALPSYKHTDSNSFFSISAGFIYVIGHW